MAARITQSQFYSVLESNLKTNYGKLALYQQQVSSGKRINRPSDDPGGSAVALALRNSQADIGRYLTAAGDARSRLDESAVLANDANATLASVRELVVRGMSDTMNASSRQALANEIEQLGLQLLQIANTQSDGTYLFGGTNSKQPPFAEVTVNGQKRIVWQGSGSAARATIGAGDEVETSLPGNQLFAKWSPTGTKYAGLTGARAGTSKDQGVAFEELTVRHDATNAVLGAGIVLANGGANDTLIGTRSVEVDAANNQVRLGTGAWTPIPSAASGQRTGVIAKDENGAEVHFDFSAWSGVDLSGSATGTGSVSIDGTNFTTIDLTETNLQLTDAVSGAIIHLNTTGITRSGRDLVNFGGTSNAFDIIGGLVADLRNPSGMSTQELQKRLGSRLVELDAKHDDVLVGLSALGSRSARTTDVQERLNGRSIELQGRLEKVEDVDLTSAVLEITRAQQTLELVQSTGSRMLRTSLLDYLR
ncbi:MAG: flagellar hook-associated protein FlgL [Planctomycetes bacterium]|nr:flagellar hook-associated protein FlgL [Planctomycetota bacterium]